MTADWVGDPMSGKDHYLDIESLVRGIHGDLGRVAFRILGHHADAEDAVQNACIKAMQSWPKVACLETAAQQHAYLFKTVTNEALQIIRQSYRKRELFTVEGTEPGQTETGWTPELPGDSGWDAKERLRRVWQDISELPDGNREVMVLFAGGYEYQEISEMLDVEVSTVRSHVNWGRKRLHRAAPDDKGEEGLK